MRQIFIRPALPFLFMMCLFSAPFTPAQAADDAIQQTIESQLKAFQADDAAKAYSYAAPSIQSMFPSADIFMSMVKQGYQPVYRPQSYLFTERKQMGNRVAQLVEIIGPKGGAWTALYTLEQQADGAWKITSCQLQKAPDASA